MAKKYAKIKKKIKIGAKISKKFKKNINIRKKIRKKEKKLGHFFFKDKVFELDNLIFKPQLGQK